MSKALVTAALLAISPFAAQAEGCAPLGGIEIAKVEAMNQMILDLNFSGFATAIKTEIGIDIKEDINSIAEIFGDGFDGCATVAQRSDTGGMVQNVVIFNGKPGPLFGYWLSIPTEDGYRLLSFTIHTDLGQVMSSLR